MLRKIFGNNSIGGGTSGGQVSRSNRRDRRSSKEDMISDNYKRKKEDGTIKRTMDEEHFASGMPGDHPSLSDKLDSHKAGTLFKYAVITNAPSEERSGMLSRLRSFKPSTQVDTLTLDGIEAIRLVGETVNFSLKSAIDPSVMKHACNFMLIDCILVHFIPLDSFANDKSVVTIQINDFRRTQKTAVRAAKVDNTMGYNVLFSLDYCVETKDADKMTLSFSCPTKDFQEGISWAAVKVVAQIQFLSFPKRVPLIESIGVALFSDTDLEEFTCDPRELDLVLTPNALNRLRESKQRGEIENLTLPKNDKQEMVTAKTILGENFGDEKVGSQIERMKEMAILKERQSAAKITNLQKLAEINKRSQSHSEKMVPKRDFSGETIVEEVDAKSDSGVSLKSVNVNDSASQVGDSISEVNEQIEAAKGRRGVMFSG